ncbi:uncharacterized protein [Miscanthus floridulus]|uniref:uncharacterized protein n=1 Tax=Miscanthus floridulus TaxID=154761 RepID=UPI0034577429
MSLLPQFRPNASSVVMMTPAPGIEYCAPWQEWPKWARTPPPLTRMRAIHHCACCRQTHDLIAIGLLRTKLRPITPLLATAARAKSQPWRGTPLCEALWEEALRWQRTQRPEEPGVRNVAVDPFSLRQFSHVDIDRPLPIPSVSVDDSRVSPARPFHGASVPAGSASSSPRASTAGGQKAPAAPTCWDGPGARPIAPSGALPRSKLSAGGDETELADAGFHVALSSTERNKASEPQRWGSDVPLIAAADAEEYSFGGYAAKDGRSKQAKHAGKAPFTCCMFVPGLTRRIKPPAPTSRALAAARSSSSGTFGKTTRVQLQPIDPGTCSARPSTVSLAVSFERFDCGGPSTSSSPRGLGLDDGEDPSVSSYFDLPLELILGCDAEDDADLPVCAAFLFDSDGIRKSVLKRRLEAGAGWEPRRPSLGKVSMDASGRISNAHVRVPLKSRSP